MSCVINGIDVNTCNRQDILTQMLHTLQATDAESRMQKACVRSRMVQLTRKSGGKPQQKEGGKQKNFASESDFIKQSLLIWVQNKTCGYHLVNVRDFSKSWSSGLAFCALLHHYAPHRIDFDKHSPETRRMNFETAFKILDEEFEIYPLLDVNDMVAMDAPDWKSVFAYVQIMYKALKGKDPEV